jgi:glycine cleavage system H lipoate-binding protein
MNCPFLKEARVKYCGKSACRKMIPTAGSGAQEICSTPRFRECPVYERQAETGAGEQCPYLREALAHYCATSAVARFIPHNELPSGCACDSFRYCDVYLGAGLSMAAGERCDHSVGGMRMPAKLYFTANHIWLDMAPSGACHIGVDAFLTRVLGTVERITFLRQTGAHRPSAVITARGVDLRVIFPHAITLAASNMYLRANPAKLTADPYGMGWLFQGTPPDREPVTDGLIHGDAIVPWIEHEIDRMSSFLGECWVCHHGAQLMNDGGVFSPGVIEQLSREEVVHLFDEFFWGSGV